MLRVQHTSGLRVIIVEYLAIPHEWWRFVNFIATTRRGIALPQQTFVPLLEWRAGVMHIATTR